MSFLSLSVRQYPKSDLAVVKVSTVYVGADAELVRGFVTTPLERIIASADGIDYLRSSSRQGISEIYAHLKLNFDVNDALTQIQAKVAQVRNELPPEAESPTISVESGDTRIASMYLSFYSDVMEQNEITDYLTRVVQPQLSAVSGVQRADILGARTFAMRVWLKSREMKAHSVSASEVRDALVRNNVLAAVGKTKGGMVSFNLTTNSSLSTKAEFEQLVVSKKGDSLVRLRDIADIELGAESYDDEVRFDGKKATFMGIWVLPNANTLEVIKRVKQEIPDIQTRAPPSLHVSIAYDATEYIDDAINEVFFTLLETITIVMIVISLFIGSARGVLIPSVAIPLSLIGVGTMLFFLGFTVNLLTLLAIVLSVGIVVDDAIVMLENIERHISEGKSPMEAALIGARELSMPIIAMTITLAAVYVPIALQGGLKGALFREFAFTLSGAVLVSGFVALTLSPMMGSRLLKKEEPSRFKLYVDNQLLRLRLFYGRVLDYILPKRQIVALTSFISLVLFFVIFSFLSIFIPSGVLLKRELAPMEDSGVVFGIVQAAPNSTIEQTVRYTEEVQKVFTSFPEYKQSFQITQPQGGFSGILLKPWSERKGGLFSSRMNTASEIAEIGFSRMWSEVPGIRVIVTTPPPLPGGTNFPIELVISSTDDSPKIYEYAREIVNRALAAGVFTFVDTDLKYDLADSKIVFDRDKVNFLGLKVSDLTSDLGILLSGNYVNRFSIQGRSYKVIPQVQRIDRLTPEQILDLPVGPALAPLSTFATIEKRVEARELPKFQQLNSATIQANNVPVFSVDFALTTLEKIAREVLPKGYTLDYAGESRQLRKELGGSTMSVVFALIAVYLVLASQFESFRDPFIILVGTVPLAIFGSLLIMFYGFTSLNIYSQVGLVTLVGLISKNGILIVEFANVLMAKGRNALDAVREASLVRLRPVLMTSAATVLGHFPLILASGAGSGARNSIGYTLVIGMIIGSVFTLLILPCLYVLVKKRAL
jgi:multidrug efflux pump